MSDLSTYMVISTGQIHEDFGLEDVKRSFATLLKTTPEKADKYVGVQKILKKNLELSKAQALKTRLEKIGMVIALKEHTAVGASASSLAIEEKVPAKEDTTMTCPKCNLQQEKAEQCTGCGVYVKKLLAPSANDTIIGQTTIMKKSEVPVQEDSESSFTSSASKSKSLKITGIIAAGVVAILGALLWKYISVWFGYEFAIIAIGIGFAVGIAAVMFESEGVATGVICAIFTLLSIFGGKYMAMSNLQETWVQDISTAIEGEEETYRKYYKQDIAAANAFGNGIDDRKELVVFLNDHGYSEFYDVENITDAEIADFNEYVVPHLKRISETNPTFEEWLDGTFNENVKEMSTMSLMFLNFGILGIVFLFLGVGAAFKMGLGDAD